jgi:hypothetical protein
VNPMQRMALPRNSFDANAALDERQNARSQLGLPAQYRYRGLTNAPFLDLIADREQLSALLKSVDPTSESQVRPIARSLSRAKATPLEGALLSDSLYATFAQYVAQPVENSAAALLRTGVDPGQTPVKASNAVTTIFSVLEKLAGAIEGPEDWAAEHDHYLYGTPKRPRE